ncbi:rhomboid family intramembrane serine protease [Rubrivirga sp.]|uniref:rhomboid family intramembrane serine protease n=1 Tax=Rubrivirga sp. TaxID=1885344 RepID=UPI003C7793E9
MQNAYRPPSSFGLFPPVVKNLLIINGLVFLAQMILEARSAVPYDALERLFMLWPIGGPEAIRFADGTVEFGTFYPWQIVTSAFMHGGIGHIFFNLFGLWMFGGTVERELGSKRFLIFYFACVLGASALQLGVQSWPFLMGADGIPVPTLGASGGVLGVLAAFGLLHPNSPIFLLFLPVPIPAKYFVLGYAAFSLFAGFSGVQAGVAHFAHLGGMVMGAVMILYWLGRLPIQPRTRIA